MIHIGELTLEERGAIELLHSAMRRLADRYSVGGDWRTHHQAAYNLLAQKVTELLVQAGERGSE